MSITYPRTLPTSPTFRSMDYIARDVVGFNASPFTGQQQVYRWPGQWWEVACELPPIANDEEADNWITFLLALEGRYGTFYMGPSTRKTPRSGIGGAVTIATATANSTNITVSGPSNIFSRGDWIQIGTTTNARLHRVTQVNGFTDYDIWPRCRSSYAGGTSVIYTNPVGIFRLAESQANWSVNVAKHTGISFRAIEVL